MSARIVQIGVAPGGVDARALAAGAIRQDDPVRLLTDAEAARLVAPGRP